MKLKYYFKVKNFEMLDNEQLMLYDSCNRNIRYYFDIETNSCEDYVNYD